jgi:hypothetical protein
MKPVPGNGVLVSFEQMPMGDWTPLNKPDAKVLATIDNQPAALTWQFGKGQVVLISGEEIGPDIKKVVDLEMAYREPGKPKDPAKGKIYWDARVDMRKDFIKTVMPLYKDLANVAGEIPDRMWAVNGLDQAYYKHKGLDHHYLCMFNPDTKQPTQEITATLCLPAGVYDVQYWSLDGHKWLGERTAEELAKGIKLESIPPLRMRTLRVERIH